MLSTLQDAFQGRSFLRIGARDWTPSCCIVFPAEGIISPCTAAKILVFCWLEFWSCYDGEQPDRLVLQSVLLLFPVNSNRFLWESRMRGTCCLCLICGTFSNCAAFWVSGNLLHLPQFRYALFCSCWFALQLTLSAIGLLSWWASLV